MNGVGRGLVSAAVVLVLHAGAGSTDGDLILQNADFNENRLINGELVSTLRGNVEFHYNDMKIFSDNARWWRDQGTIRLNDNVRVEQPHQVLTCDRMVFERSRDELTASGNFLFINTRDRIRLSGTTGRYHTRSSEFVLSGSPLFVRFDTTAAETLTIAGRSMTYNDSLGLATVSGDVRINRGELRGRSERARYYTEQERARLRGSPDIVFDSHSLTGDSIDLVFRGDTLEGIVVEGNALGLYREVNREDTSLTEITSDSMYMQLTAGSGLDSVWAVGNAVSTYYLSTRADTANEARGRQMILGFNSDGGLESAVVFGSARSVYYLLEDDGRGRNEASGDSIRVTFLEGKARAFSMSGAVRGVYYPLPD